MFTSGFCLYGLGFCLCDCSHSIRWFCRKGTGTEVKALNMDAGMQVGCCGGDGLLWS